MTNTPIVTVAQQLMQSYRSTRNGQAIGRRYIPSVSAMLEFLHLCRQVLFPGLVCGSVWFDHTDPNWSNSSVNALEALLTKLHQTGQEQISHCLCYGSEQRAPDCAVPCCQQRAAQLIDEFIAQLPEIRRILLVDAQAALKGDPAATSVDEIVLAYPGYLAITVHRIAHALFLLGIPMMPRILSEWAHSHTGADIHPGAQIGEGFFLDHATGAVIGATAKLGRGVRLYQGVTLGALSLPRDRQVEMEERNPEDRVQRHPTIGDEVTIYANASVLGGHTVVGSGSIVGGSVVLTGEVPPNHIVSLSKPTLRLKSLKQEPEAAAELYWEI